MWREFGSPDKAIRFNNLYTRLLTVPILNRKGAILSLFNQLSEGEGPLPASPQSPKRPPEIDGQPALDADHARTSLGDASLARVNQGPPKETPRRPQSAQQTAEPHSRSRSDAAHAQPPKEKPQPTSESYEGNRAPSESALLRDLPFTLQGLSSTNLQFASAEAITLPPDLPLPILSLLHTLAEPSLLYRSLSDFVQSREKGLVEQSLRAAIGIELRSYLGLIATLEAEIRRAAAASAQQDGQPRASKIGVTLKRCVVWTREATTGLRLMILMAEESKSELPAQGGKLC